MRRRLSIVPDLPADTAAALLSRPPGQESLASLALDWLPSLPLPLPLPAPLSAVRCVLDILLELVARVALGLSYLAQLIRGLATWAKRQTHAVCARPPPKTMNQLWQQEMQRRGFAAPLERGLAHSRKILVLDLDETLIHSSQRPPIRCDTWVDVFTDSGSASLAVFIRPHLAEFLEKVAQWYHVYIFTASVRGYADPIINRIDSTRTIFSRRFYREDCTRIDANYVKDLRKVHHHLGSVILVDNSDVSFQLQPENGVPISSWLGDDNSDCALLALLPLLEALRHTRDVRSVLSLRPHAQTHLAHV